MKKDEMTLQIEVGFSIEDADEDVHVSVMDSSGTVIFEYGITFDEMHAQTIGLYKYTFDDGRSFNDKAEIVEYREKLSKGLKRFIEKEKLI